MDFVIFSKGFKTFHMVLALFLAVLGLRKNSSRSALEQTASNVLSKARMVMF